MHTKIKTIVWIGFANSHGLRRVMVSDSLQTSWELYLHLSGNLYYKWMRVSFVYAKYVPGNHGGRKRSKCAIGLSVSTGHHYGPPSAVI